MPLANEFKVRGNLLPEGFTVPKVTSWPPDAIDGQLIWKLPEDNLFLYKASEDAWFPVSEKQYHFDRVSDQVALINGLSFLQLRTNKLWHYAADRNFGTWDQLYRYCYWQFATSPDSNTFSSAQQFSTENAFYTFLESYVPNNGTGYTTNIRYRCWESVDDEDYFPNRLHFRNSLAAAIMGRGRYCSRQAQFGVSTSFNNPNHYTNWRNQLGQRFVWAATDVLPLTNNDDVVWFHSGKRGTQLRFPQIGGAVVLVGGVSLRGAAWDTIASTYVSPAPDGAYIVMEPFFLIDEDRLGTLSIDRDFGTAPVVDRIHSLHRMYEMTSPMVAVFPVGFGAGPSVNVPYRYYGFVVVPVNTDNFITEILDANHEISLCIKYRSSYEKRYTIADLQGTGANKYAIWQTPGLFGRDGGRMHNDVDKDSVPVRVDLARRDKLTGTRSAWRPLYDIQRRVHHVAVRVYPSRNREH